MISSTPRRFTFSDFEHAPKIHLLLMAVPDEKKAAALLLFHKYRYSDFALDKPFMPQFTANIKNLNRRYLYGPQTENHCGKPGLVEARS